jgi:hypothetical protein
LEEIHSVSFTEGSEAVIVVVVVVGSVALTVLVDFKTLEGPAVALVSVEE